MELRALLTVSLTTLLLLYHNRTFFNLENPLAADDQNDRRARLGSRFDFHRLRLIIHLPTPEKTSLTSCVLVAVSAR